MSVLIGAYTLAVAVFLGAWACCGVSGQCSRDEQVAADRRQAERA